MNRLQLQDAILETFSRVYEDVDTQNIRISGSVLKSELIKNGAKHDIRDALEELSQLDYIVTSGDSLAREKIKTTPVGLGFYRAGYRFSDGATEDQQSSTFDDDKVIELDQTSLEVIDVADELASLRRALSEANDVGGLSPEEIDVAVAEVSLLSNLWSQTRVRASQLIATAQSTLSWIVERAAGAAVGEIAKRLLEAIVRIVS